MVLEDDVDVRPEFLETELTGVFPVYEDLATWAFDNSQKPEHKSTFPASCSANDSYLFARVNCQVDVLEDIVVFWSVSERVVLEDNLAVLEDFFAVICLREVTIFNPVIL